MNLINFNLNYNQKWLDFDPKLSNFDQNSPILIENIVELNSNFNQNPILSSEFESDCNHHPTSSSSESKLFMIQLVANLVSLAHSNKILEIF